MDQNNGQKKHMCKMTQFLTLDLTNLVTAVASRVVTLRGRGPSHEAATVHRRSQHFEKHCLA